MAAVHFLNRSEPKLLEPVSRLAYANPFLPERVECERAVLGAEFIEGEAVWSYRAENPEPRANIWRIAARLEPLLEDLRTRLRAGARTNANDLVLYEDAVLQFL